MVDELVRRKALRTPRVEAAFRRVDRGHFAAGHDHSYEDTPLRDAATGLHLSAPHIYASVAEALQLERGMRFLHVGSGSGYFSTIASCLVGRSGVSHGVECSQRIVTHARARQAAWFTREKSAARDAFELLSTPHSSQTASPRSAPPSPLAALHLPPPPPPAAVPSPPPRVVFGPTVSEIISTPGAVPFVLQSTGAPSQQTHAGYIEAEEAGGTATGAAAAEESVGAATEAAAAEEAQEGGAKVSVRAAGGDLEVSVDAAEIVVLKVWWERARASQREDERERAREGEKDRERTRGRENERERE